MNLNQYEKKIAVLSTPKESLNLNKGSAYYNLDSI